jgi:23S rRNA pseudouridine1911/1915/1917 synthase
LPAGPGPSAGAGSTPDRSWTLTAEVAGDKGRKLDGVLRELLQIPWSEARRLVETGKVTVGGRIAVKSDRPVRVGDVIELRLRAPRPRTARIQELGGDLVVYIDASVVVVRKPPGLSTVPFGDEPEGEEVLTLDALVREVVAKRDRIRGRAPLGVVHRLDKATSGLLVFARTVAAKKHLGQQFRVHSMHRLYLAIAHGDVRAQTFRSHLIENRGDGIRGSAKDRQREGQLAITHVEPQLRVKGATLVACRLETGRTHQIRIHLSEAGHPLVGESVYIRGYAGPRIEAPRLMLHAAELGFAHPEDDRPMLFSEPLPADFEDVLDRLRSASGAT